MKRTAIWLLLAVSAGAVAQDIPLNPWTALLREKPSLTAHERLAILGQFIADKTDKALPAIVGALGDPDGIVVSPAVHELARRRSASTFAVMVQLASSQINKGGWETMYEMQRYPYSQSKPFFKEHWNTPDPIARKFLTGALGMKAEPEEFWT